MTEPEYMPPPIYPVEIIPMERRQTDRRRSAGAVETHFTGDERRVSRGRRTEDHHSPGVSGEKEMLDNQILLSEAGCGRNHAMAAEAIGLICDALEKLTESAGTDELARARAIAAGWNSMPSNGNKTKSE